jgi:hypothetical protein
MGYGNGIATDGRCERLQLGRGGDDSKLGLREGREQDPADESYFLQSDFGITQTTFFCSPDMSPMRQSIAALARP